jgi:hypothetical protein
MDMIDRIKNIPPEIMEKMNKKQIEVDRKMYAEFKDAFDKNCCSLCGNKLDYFHESETCFHWFLRPNGIKKRHFKEYLSEPIGFYALECYFRWIASMEAIITNINDLSDEMSKSKLREITIKFKNIEWSLNFGKSDLEGHSDSKNANFPHFHLQMNIDNRPFIRFNDFHIPFSKSDLIEVKLNIEERDLIYYDHNLAEGMSFLEDPQNRKEIEETLQVADNEDSAIFRHQSFIQMPNGKTMNGDVLLKLSEESKKTRIPLRHLIQQYYPDAKIQTQTSLGPGVPEMKKRNKR